MSEDKFGRRSSDKDFEVRICTLENRTDYMADKLTHIDKQSAESSARIEGRLDKVEGKIDVHTIEETDRMIMFSSNLSTNTEAIKGLAVALNNLASTHNSTSQNVADTLVKVNDKLDATNNIVATHAKQLSGYQIVGFTLWKVGIGVAGLVSGVWAVITYFGVGK